eukprot:TRINITY_DN39356_c0_g1_i1.p1 TRINITY_DN39356_c0_g1~~TRINITY_DN39356_c0_g1_i1.p1  ORF type:complete len:341 (+),score=78.47 TRINITY_DN39356_c0_g1_i1:162-1184(+)
MAETAVNLGLSALDVVTGLSSNRLDKESVQLAKAGLGCAQEELAVSQQSLGLDRDALKLAKKGVQLDEAGLELARRMERLEQRNLQFSEESLKFSDQSVLAAHADLSRNREWKLVEEKTQQLKAISNLSALIAGFAMVSLVELVIPDDVNTVLLILYGTFTAAGVCSMLTTMLTTSMMLVYILNYRQVTDLSFKTVWANKCESDWRRSFNCFKFGVPCFIVSLGCISWIKFQTNNETANIVVCSAVTVIAVFSLAVWIVYVKIKYGTDPDFKDLEEELENERLCEGVIREKAHLRELQRRLVRTSSKDNGNESWEDVVSVGVDGEGGFSSLRASRNGMGS